MSVSRPPHCPTVLWGSQDSANPGSFDPSWRQKEGALLEGLQGQRRLSHVLGVTEEDLGSTGSVLQRDWWERDSAEEYRAFLEEVIIQGRK